MASVNRITLIGNLGADPEIRYTAGGEQVASISLATTETWKDGAGEKREETTWHRVSFFGRLAEIAGEYLRKGGQCYVEGRYRSRKYTTKDGSERTVYEVVGDRLVLLGGQRADSDRQPSAPSRAAKEAARQGRPQPSGGIADLDDDIPF